MHRFPRIRMRLLPTPEQEIVLVEMFHLVELLIMNLKRNHPYNEVPTHETFSLKALLQVFPDSVTKLAVARLMDRRRVPALPLTHVDLERKNGLHFASEEVFLQGIGWIAVSHLDRRIIQTTYHTLHRPTELRPTWEWVTIVPERLQEKIDAS